MLIVEQNAELALDITDRGYIMQIGQIAAHGESRELIADPIVQQTYMGMKG